MSEQATGSPAPQTPFHDLEAFVALPRLSGLALSPDGGRLATVVAAPDPSGTRYVPAIWEVDPAGARPPRRLTRGAKGESGPVFGPDGSLFFVSSRPDPEAEDADDDAPPALWLLPPDGGEAHVVAARPGGVGGVVVARAAGTLVFGSDTLPSSASLEDEANRRAARKDRKITAVLHEEYPVRHWDADLGPARRRLLVASPPTTAADQPPATDQHCATDQQRPELRDLTGHVGRALGPEAGWDVTSDGRTVVASWTVPEPEGSERQTLVAIDAATGTRRVLLDDPDLEFSDPVTSPDGTHVAAMVHLRTAHTVVPDRWLVVVDLATGETREVGRDWDRWPAEPPTWAPDGAALLLPADDDGGAPVFRIDLPDGAVTRLTTDRGAYSSVCIAPDGTAAYAVRSAIDATPSVVRFDPRTPGDPVPLPSPVAAPALPGRLDEVVASAADGTRLRGWLALPHAASGDAPAPLLLWIHGGPLGSWNAWSWRWNPWLMVAAGYAVLLPDPALSTGYGRDFIGRGWARWGAEPYTDLMSLTDAALLREDLDPGRTAAMGGSFGGYMANWIAGHTDRFRGIVTHASLWALDQFGPTTDAYFHWRREFGGGQMEAKYSPHLFVDEIRTPMLVIHGDKDYRVPVGEALRLWAELAERSEAADGVLPHKFLLFPDENHWVLTPQHAIVWYQTVLAFLATTVRGEPWQAPELLR